MQYQMMQLYLTVILTALTETAVVMSGLNIKLKH